ncbi:MAG: hypothetical protein PHX57_08800, partial [Desulfobulbaceae bacterium]|nr:hypothetical protein [Desulfobulbaceae bacterium]
DSDSDSDSDSDTDNDTYNDADDDLDHDISNVEFYAVNGGAYISIKLDYTGSAQDSFRDAGQPQALFDDISNQLSGTQYDGYEVVGYTIKAGQDFSFWGDTPSSETPGQFNDSDLEGTFNGTSVSIGGLSTSTQTSSFDQDEFESDDDDDPYDQYGMEGDDWDQVQDPFQSEDSD